MWGNGFLENIKMVNLEEYEGAIDWRAYLYDTSVYLFLFNEKVIAEAVLFDDSNSIIIDNIETRFKNIGIGTYTVKRISDYAKENRKKLIKGESVPEAEIFWSSFNAQFKYDDKDDLIPFTIKCEDIDYYFNKKIKLNNN